MTQPTHDEKVALVEKAKGIVDYEVAQCQSTLNTFKMLRERGVLVGGSEREDQGQRFLNSWLAHHDTFKRHEEFDDSQIETYCYLCLVPYPCPESVTTADLLVNGTSK